MDINNLALAMGPTIMGSSSNDPMSVESESSKFKAMKGLLAISADYW
jgi:hypothetical protein